MKIEDDGSGVNSALKIDKDRLFGFSVRKMSFSVVCSRLFWSYRFWCFIVEVADLEIFPIIFHIPTCAYLRIIRPIQALHPQSMTITELLENFPPEGEEDLIPKIHQQLEDSGKTLVILDEILILRKISLLYPPPVA